MLPQTKCPTPVVCCQPVVRQKHCFKMPKWHMPKMNWCHKRAACAPAPVCIGAPVPAEQAMPSAQATAAPQA